MADHAAEPAARSPTVVDHTKEDQFDAYLLKVWKLEKLHPYRNPLAEWNELVKALAGNIDPDERDAFELALAPFVIRF